MRRRRTKPPTLPPATEPNQSLGRPTQRKETPRRNLLCLTGCPADHSERFVTVHDADLAQPANEGVEDMPIPVEHVKGLGLCGIDQMPDRGFRPTKRAGVEMRLLPIHRLTAQIGDEA